MAASDGRTAAPLVVRVSGEDYPIAPDLVARLLGPAPPPGFRCDGLTMAPDSWPPWWWSASARVDLTPAGVWHDAAYRLGGSRRDRLRADARFYYNLVHLGLSEGWAGVYYRRVRLWGLPHFGWAPGEEPSALTAGVAALLHRYRIPSPAALAPPMRPVLEAAAGLS